MSVVLRGDSVIVAVLDREQAVLVTRWQLVCLVRLSAAGAPAIGLSGICGARVELAT